MILLSISHTEETLVLPCPYLCPCPCSWVSGFSIFESPRILIDLCFSKSIACMLCAKITLCPRSQRLQDEGSKQLSIGLCLWKGLLTVLKSTTIFPDTFQNQAGNWLSPRSLHVNKKAKNATGREVSKISSPFPETEL